ncbi:hypothetical protein JMY81_21365 [Brenneria goodwinii]|uniref:Uncharacterized protein n=1 Tax=Brenneria goodwinii TaxID=1109412 RepID=A0A0G4JT80_9GAMM|nr:hypothetical protein [Brenneria goodwinii]ATA25956.1 hypothetical protein AWC36_18570 [Brenneria goodwinii]MCG8157334.1 hypothetical protein [Brenneria goodwinii]MCG8163343.1 hypothetical protein [Brenneria goodwinii]MCG8165148.1 hypothetical protein [Brenneria goodwinii]MCG8170884.1 hypothetical protein [Brenneria goodwinii]
MISKKPKIKVSSVIKFILKILLLMFITLVIVAIIEMIYTSTRNYLGYCTWDNQRMGKRYTTQERLDIAIAKYLQYQITDDYLEIRKAERINSDDFDELEQRFILIQYNSKEAFIKENPACCERTWGLVEGPVFDLWERTDGIGDGMFDFRHKIRYIDKKHNTYKEIFSKYIYYQVNNCGYALGLSLT